MRQLTDRLYLRGRVWWCWGYDANGKRWAESTHQRSKKAAITACREIERRRAVPANRAADTLTLTQALGLLMQHLKRDDAADSTVEFYTCKGRHLCRLLGHQRRVASLAMADSIAYMDARLAEDAHRHTVQKEFRTLVYALNCAKDIELYEGIPASLVPKALRKARSYYVPCDTWLDAEESQQLLDHIGNAPQVRVNRRLHVAAYLHTGVRKGELYTILPEHVDLKARTVWVDGTKTDGSRRLVHLSDTAVAVFRAKLKTATPGQQLFEHWASAGRDLKAAAARADLPELSFNDLRRTFCSLMATSGVPMQHCAKLMGHKSLDMVLRVYGRLAPESLQEAVSKLPALAIPGVTDDVATQAPETTPDSPNDTSSEALSA